MIVLFGIFTVYFYSSLSDRTHDQVTSVDGLSTESANALKTNLANGRFLAEVVTKGGTKDKPAVETHKIFFKGGPDPASVDFAKQLMTLMGTLVTAIASFYFGSATVKVSAGGGPSGPAGNPAAPSLKTIAPATITTRDTPVKLSMAGDGLAGVNAVALKHDGWKDIEARDVTPTATQVVCNVVVPSDAPKGPWTVKVTGSSGEAQLPNVLQVS